MYPSTLLQELNSMRIVLASSSKIREDLLRRLNLNFEIRMPTYEENLNPDDYSISEYVEETALGKLLSVEKILHNEGIRPDIIIGADTMVEYQGKLYGKPKCKQEVVTFLTTLSSSGLPNTVHTGVVIKYKGQTVKFVVSTVVHIGLLSKEEILAYVNTGEAMNCAGRYAIQGIAGSFIEGIEGDYNNVIGLPLCRLRKELKKLALCNGVKSKF